MVNDNFVEDVFLLYLDFYVYFFAASEHSVINIIIKNIFIWEELKNFNLSRKILTLTTITTNTYNSFFYQRQY